jgi:DNA mismatch repair ATPase MutS
LNKIQANIEIIFSISDSISLLDVLTSFAIYKIESKIQTSILSFLYFKLLARPRFDEDICALSIIKSKHPMLDGLKENVIAVNMLSFYEN